MEPAKRLHPAITALVIIVLVGIVATAVIVINTNADKTDTSGQTTRVVEEAPAHTDAAPADSGASTSTYVDGTYSATGSYSSPGGRESVELTVTLKDGIITSTSLATNPASRDSRSYQASFTSAYKELVVGKSVDRVSLSRVAGSSLTSNGFNNALDQIKTDAKA